MNCKFKIQYVAGFFIALLISSQVNAQTYRLNANYFVRSNDRNFSDEASKIGVLTAGSEFTVKSVKTMRNGAEALEIEVTNLAGKSKVNPSPTGKIWIYKGVDQHFTEISSSEIAKTKTEADCNGNCGKESVIKVDPTQKNNLNAIKDASRELIASQNSAESVIIAPAEKSKTKSVVRVAEVKTPVEIKEAKIELATASVTRLPGNLDEQIKNYSNSSEVAAALNWADKNKNARSTRKCYRKVKQAMSAKDKNGNSLIPSWYSDIPAINAKTSLKDRGFLNLMEIEPYKSKIKSPSQAPKGAVLVYSSGLSCGKIKDCGHVELKTDHEGKPGYVSDYRSNDAINETPAAKRFGTRYKLVGVMIKPMENP